jgi:hypothetical protein
MSGAVTSAAQRAPTATPIIWFCAGDAHGGKEKAMEEADDEPLFCDRAAGIDIGKQAVMVTVRVPSGTRRGGRAQETREFGTTRRQLLELADWLRSWGVERAGMESTSDYWKPVSFLLEQQGFDCVLYQASKVKAQPGRPKTGKLDSVWLAKVVSRQQRRSPSSGRWPGRLCHRKRFAGCALIPVTAGG